MYFENGKIFVVKEDDCSKCLNAAKGCPLTGAIFSEMVSFNYESVIIKGCLMLKKKTELKIVK